MCARAVFVSLKPINEAVLLWARAARKQKKSTGICRKMEQDGSFPPTTRTLGEQLSGSTETRAFYRSMENQRNEAGLNTCVTSHVRKGRETRGRRMQTNQSLNHTKNKKVHLFSEISEPINAYFLPVPVFRVSHHSLLPSQLVAQLHHTGRL